jgi:hypothetical protein
LSDFGDEIKKKRLMSLSNISLKLFDLNAECDFSSVLKALFLALFEKFFLLFKKKRKYIIYN